MAARGILLQCIPSDKREKSVCSGVLFAEKWVLTLGSILDFHPNSETVSTTSRHHVEELRLLESSFSEIHIIPYQSAINEHIFNVIVENEATSTSGLPAARGDSAVTPYKFHDARLVAMWRCPLLSAAVHTLLSDWQLTASEENTPGNAQKTQGSSKMLLSSFLLFQIYSCPNDRNSLLSGRDVKNKVMRLFQQIEIPKRGQEVVIESTLFGREFFLNSLSQGVLSNKLGPRGCLLLTDARSGLGCEGGPIFTNTSQRGLLGLVVSSLSWWKGEWVGFTLGVALHPVLAHLCSGGQEVPEIALKSKLPTSNLGEMEKSVLLVRCGRSWGSGVVVDAPTGLVLTCSHVVKKADAAISVVWRGRKLDATLVYRTRDGVAYDLALLSVAAPPSDMQQARLSGSTPKKGEAVFVVGFPMFSERTDSNPSPTVTRGIISHVAPPVMLQTTCCIQSGASGAPVFSGNGEMLAVISCNARDIDAGVVFPHVNMAVPVTAFLGPLQQYIDTRDVTALSKLEEQDELAQKMWKLNFTTSSL